MMRAEAAPSSAQREDVALANRIVHAAGLVTAFGHVSARIPDTDTFLIPTRASPALAHLERLLVMDTSGRVCAGEGHPNSESWIHARIYANRPDVGAVAHVHAPSCVVIGQIGGTVHPLHNSGAVFGQVPVFDRIGLINTRELGEQVAAVLGEARAMLLRGHGANVVAGDVREATVLAGFLEEAAELQLRALAATGGQGSPRYFDEEERTRAASQLSTPETIARAWDYYAALIH